MPEVACSESNGKTVIWHWERVRIWCARRVAMLSPRVAMWVAPKAKEDSSAALSLFDGVVGDVRTALSRPQLMSRVSFDSVDEMSRVLREADDEALVRYVLDVAGPGSDGAVGGFGGADSADELNAQQLLLADLDLPAKRTAVAREAGRAVFLPLVVERHERVLIQSSGCDGDSAGRGRAGCSTSPSTESPSLVASEMLQALRSWVETGEVVCGQVRPGGVWSDEVSRAALEARGIGEFLRHEARGGNAAMARLLVIAQLVPAVVAMQVVQDMPRELRALLRKLPRKAAKDAMRGLMAELRRRGGSAKPGAEAAPEPVPAEAACSI